MTRDLRYAARALRRSPLFTATATLALALAIGANAAIFGLVEALWFRPPGVRHPSTLVRVFATTPTERQASWSYPEYIEIREGVTAFEGAVARGRRGAMLASASGTPELILVNVVSPNFFTTLGVSATHGRVFTEADQRNPAATAVLGHAFWQTRFGADPSIVGRTIPLGRGAGSIPVTVLGVLPPAFRELDAAADRDAWLPPFTWQQLAGRNELDDRASRWFEVFARLRPGTSAAAAHGETSILAGSIASRFPATNSGRGARVVADLDYRLEAGGATAAALLALVLLVIAITCVNVANLLLARAEGRAGELALRSALGAARWRITRQLLAECILLGALGSVGGLVVGAWLIRLLPAIMGAPPGFRSFLVFETDARVIAFTFGTTVLTTVLFGIAPSLMATKTDVGSIMKGGSGLTGSGRSGGVFRQALVVTQIAVSLVLLCAAGVLVRSFARTQSADLGFARTPVLTAWGSSEVPPDTALQAVRQLEALPGATSVAVAIRAPLSLSGGGMAQPVFFPHAPAEAAAGLPSVKFNAVSSNYFSTLGTRILRGRAFNDLDQQGSVPAIIVNERLAAQFFPGRDPLNGVVRLGGPAGTDHRIIGVAQNAAINAIGESTEPYFYLPYWTQPHGEITFFLATAGDPARLALPARDALRQLDARLEPRRLITMGEYIEHSARVYQTTALLASALGTIGLMLTALGVYGVIAYRLMRRGRELAVRVAVGAAPAQMVSMLIREGLRLLFLGLAIGIPGALAATRQMTSLLFGIAPWDTPAFLASTGLLLVVVGTAVLIPALRASRVNPAALLR